MSRELDAFSAAVLEALQRVGPVVGRRMFGGLGLYRDGVFFALVYRSRLYFRVDETNRTEYEARGMEPFQPRATTRTLSSYCELPPDVLEDQRQLARWAEKSVAAARANPKKKPRRSPGRSGRIEER